MADTNPSDTPLHTLLALFPSDLINSSLLSTTDDASEPPHDVGPVYSPQFSNERFSNDDAMPTLHIPISPLPSETMSAAPHTVGSLQNNKV